MVIEVKESLDEIREGIYLVHPEGQLIYEGKKTLIVKKKKFDWEGKLKYLVSGDKCYGIIKIKKIYPISLEEFAKLRDKHLISEIERARWWTNAKELFAYEFTIIEKFDKPKNVEVPIGVQTAIKEVKFLSKITYEEETEIIRENKKGPEAFKPHKFQSAVWTHKNGHPRCLICGDEELTVETCKEFGIPKGWCKGIQISAMFEESFELGVRQAFGSPGGKSRVAKKIASLIPECNTYMEPFTGGGAVYFAKEPSELEILNDLDSEIAFSYKFLKNITDEEIETLKTKSWEANEKLWNELKESKPTNNVDRFYRFMYLMRHTYGFSAGFCDRKSPNINFIPRIPILKERLKNTLIYNKDYKEVMRKFNSEDSFAYLDPPYYKEWPKKEELGFTKEQHQEMHDFLKNEWKGKFLLSLNDFNWIREIFSDFHIRKLLVKRQLKDNRMGSEFELLISNYDTRKINANLEEYELAEYTPVGPSDDHEKGRLLGWEEITKYWKKPIILFEDFIQLIGGVPSHKDGSTGDIDILLRKTRPENESEDIPLKFRLFRALPTELGKRLHFVYDNFHGPFTSHVPVYHLALIPVEKQEIHFMSELLFEKIEDIGKDLEKINKAELIERHNILHKAFATASKEDKNMIIDIHALIWREMNRRAMNHDDLSPNDELDKESKFPIEEYPKIPSRFLTDKDRVFTPRFIKPASGYEKFEFANYDDLWDIWKEKYSPTKGIIIEPKLDGFSFNLMKSGNEIRLITEDRRRDRAEILPQVCEELRKLPIDNCNIQAECVWFRDDKALEREEAIRVIVGKEPMRSEDVKMFCHDITFLNGKEIIDYPYIERIKILGKILGKEKKYLIYCPWKIVENRDEFLKIAEKYGNLEGSEGIMGKVQDYKFIVSDSETTRTPLMAKVKKSYDIEVEVDKPQPKISTETGKPIEGQWIYYVIVRGKDNEPIPIGRTFSTAIKAIKGDILTVRTARIRGFYDPERKEVVKFSMMWPKVLEKREDVKKPTSFNELMKIAWFPKKQLELEESNLKLTILGTRGEVEENIKNHFYHTGLLIAYKDEKILFDFGKNLKGRLKELNPDAIFLTHGHPDHAFGLKEGTAKPVFASKDALGKLKEFLLEDIREIEDSKTVKIGNFRITPYLVYHSIKSPAFGFLIEVGNRKITFAPDVISFADEKKVLRDVDLYIGDGSSPFKDLIRKEDNFIFGHSSIKTQIEKCDKYGIANAIFMHFGKEFIENEEKIIPELKKVSKEVNVEFARDNQTFQFSELEQELSKKLQFIVQAHFRGKSEHLDIRFERNEHLEGWTLDDLVEGAVKKPVLTVDEAKRVLKDETLSKINWKTGDTKYTEIERDGKKIKMPQKILAQQKASQPKSWIKVKGITPPGTVGATKEYPGVFVIMDKGWYEDGVRKPYVYEFFLHGKKLNGIYIFRKLPVAGFRPKEGKVPFKIPLVWFFWKRKEQVPYMLSKRALETKTIPPIGISWLPKKIENLIPEEFRYWVPDISNEEKLKRLEGAIDFWRGREIELSYESNKIEFLKMIE